MYNRAGRDYYEVGDTFVKGFGFSIYVEYYVTNVMGGENSLISFDERRVVPGNTRLRKQLRLATEFKRLIIGYRYIDNRPRPKMLKVCSRSFR